MSQRCCDHGFNIAIGEGNFVSFGCVLLDCHRMTISSEVPSAPGARINTSAHPMNLKLRDSGAGFALLATFGENFTVGAGSLMSRDLPANAPAVANVCRVRDGTRTYSESTRTDLV